MARHRLDTDVGFHSDGRLVSQSSPSWWEISGTLASLVGLCLTPAWLYLPDRGWSSTTAYFDPWHHSAITLAMLGMGLILSYWNVARITTSSTHNKWVMASRYSSVAGVSAVVVFVLVIPLVILLIKLATAVLAAWLLLNCRRITRGQLPYIPRSVAGWVRLAEKAAEVGPHL